jgi:FMN phosphatase YigB (HAD superfamily)
MYAGDADCKRLYGFAPEHIHGEGYLEKETVLMDAELLPSKTQLGVLTGRTRTETQIAMERAGVLERIPEAAWVTEDDGVRKPDGRALSLLQERMGFKYGMYVGDTIDDLRVVQNYREMNAAGRARILCVSCAFRPRRCGQSSPIPRSRSRNCRARCEFAARLFEERPEVK